MDEATWLRHRYGIVVEGNLAKFGQHPALGAFLRGTGDQVLVEASPVDPVWGGAVLPPMLPARMIRTDGGASICWASR